MSKDYYVIERRCAPNRQIVTSELVRLLFAHNVLRNSYKTRPLLCVRITCYVTVIVDIYMSKGCYIIE
jgi:hypothetical protein